MFPDAMHEDGRSTRRMDGRAMIQVLAKVVISLIADVELGVVGYTTGTTRLSTRLIYDTPHSFGRRP